MNLQINYSMIIISKNLTLPIFLFKNNNSIIFIKISNLALFKNLIHFIQ